MLEVTWSSDPDLTRLGGGLRFPSVYLFIYISANIPSDLTVCGPRLSYVPPL